MTDQRPVCVARFMPDGALQFCIFGEGCRFLIIDEQAPHDRVYEFGHREPLEKLVALVPPDALIGHAGEPRHEALKNIIEAVAAGRPHLRSIK